MKRRARTLTVLGAMAAVIGCSNNLTKEQARQLLNDSYYAIDDNAYCSLDALITSKGGSGKTATYEFIRDDEMRKCGKELVASGIIVPADDLFTLGDGVSLTRGDKLQWPCGKKTLGEVTSISTSADKKKASVRYKRSVTLDAAMKKGLADCKVDGSEGEREETMEFSCDDDGKWTAPGKASPPGPTPKPPPPPKPFQPCPQVLACCDGGKAPVGVEIACMSAKADHLRKGCVADVTVIRSIYSDASLNPKKIPIPAGCTN